MPFNRLSLLLLLLTPLLAAAAVIRGTILPSPALPNPAVLPPTTKATLTTSGLTYAALLTRDNSFVFRNVSEGSYLFDIFSPTHHFPPLRVDVDRSGAVHAWQTFRGNVWENKGTPLPASPLELRATAAKQYLVVREGFNPLKMLGSPMILVAIVSLVFIVFLPKLVDRIDPELKKEFEETQKRTAPGGQANPMADFDVAGFLAGRSSSTAGAGGKRR